MTVLKSRLAAQQAAQQSVIVAKAKAADDGEDEKVAAEDGDEGEDEEQAKGKTKAKKKAKAKSAPKRAESDDEDDEEMAASASAAPVVVQADPGAVIELCVQSGVAHMAKTLVDAKLSMTEVKARIESAGAIRGLVMAAGRISRTIDPKLAEGFIRDGASIEHVKAEMFDLLIKGQSAEIRNSHDGDSKAGRSAVQQHGWDAAFATASPRKAV
jgi:hypothetical protein